MASENQLSRIVSPRGDEETNNEEKTNDVKTEQVDYDEENDQLDNEEVQRIKNIIHCANNVCGVIRREDLPRGEERMRYEDSIAETCEHFCQDSVPVCTECYFSNPESKYLHHLIETLEADFTKVVLTEKKTIEELRFVFSTKATFAKAKLNILTFREEPIDIILYQFLNYT